MSVKHGTFEITIKIDLELDYDEEEIEELATKIIQDMEDENEEIAGVELLDTNY